MKRLKKVFGWMMTMVLMLSMLPGMTIGVSAEDSSTESYVQNGSSSKAADPYTGNAYESIFYPYGRDGISTQNAGRVWTDKSVLSSTEEIIAAGLSNLPEGYGTQTANITVSDHEFLVGLSTIASNETITGISYSPTDTMIILDLSSSMYYDISKQWKNPEYFQEMAKSVNDSITKLQKLNPYNRVGVTIYYGGGNYDQASGNCGTVMLPLGRYQAINGKYIEVTTSNGELVDLRTVNNLKTEENTKVNQVIHECPTTAGTYAQLGILHALDQFMRDDIKPEVVIDGQTVERTPIFVFMSDGTPTAASANYTMENGKVQADIGCNTNDYRSPNETDFLTQLTAAYARAKVDEKYKNTKPLYYTLTLGTEISVDIMDPKNASSTNSGTISTYWNRLITSQNSITISGTVRQGTWNKNPKDITLTVPKNAYITSTDQRFYVDKNFEAAKGENLAEAFEEIVSEINNQSKYYPTLVDEDDDFSGNVSFVDRIGEYMSVKDIKGLVIGNRLYTGEELASRLVNLNTTTPADAVFGEEFVKAVQHRLGISSIDDAKTLIQHAYDAGQLAYDSGKDTYSNYIGWLANSKGVYIAPWNDGDDLTNTGATYIVKSYGYLGEPTGYNIDTDMMYATVQWRQNIATGEEMITFAVPASLLPTITYMVQLDDNGGLKSLTYESGDDKLTPIRLLYTVTLDNNINSETVAEVVGDYVNDKDKNGAYVNQDADGNIYFYTNAYDTNYEVGYGKVNTYSYFRPSHENSQYYYQVDETIYKDSKGTLYTGNTGPATNGTYYRKVEAYEKNNGIMNVRTSYNTLTSSVLGAAKQASDGTWYIPKGVAHFDHATYTKTTNKTNTFVENDKPYVDLFGNSVSDTNHNYIIGSTLGNNGYLNITPSTGVSITKEVTEFATGDKAAEKVFTFELQSSDQNEAGTYTGKRYDSSGNVTTENIVFTAGKATVTLKHGETLYITGMAADKQYTISEGFDKDYILSNIKVKDAVVSGALATVTTEQNSIVPVKFTNTARGAGNVTISKHVTHQMGTEYIVPDTLSFEIKGKVTLNGQPIQNTKYNTTIGNDLSSVTTDENGIFTVSLKNNESVTILDIPEGAQLEVTETPASYFTVSYKENDQTGDGKVIITKANQSVAVYNAYNPTYQPVTANIKITGTKSFIDETGNDKWNGETFKFKLQKSDGQNWVDVTDLNGIVVADEVTNVKRVYEISHSLSFSAIGTYAYRVVEETPSLPADYIVYDSKVYAFSVHVTDKDMDGALEIDQIYLDSEKSEFSYAKGVYSKTGADFENKYTVNKPTEIKIDMIKEMLNPSGSSLATLDGYTFGLYGGFDDATGNVTGQALLTTDATDTTGSTGLTLNFYPKGAVLSQVIKTYEVGDTETYYVKEIAGTQSNMKYSEQVYKVDVTFTDGGEGKLSATTTYSVFDKLNNQWVAYTPSNSGLSFTNEYTVQKPAEIQLDVSKTLIGKELTTDAFEFKLEAVTEGAPLPTTTSVKNGADGTVNFGTMTYQKVGTYQYTVTEVIPTDAVLGSDGRYVYQGVSYDSTVYHVEVTVRDSGSGLLVATQTVLELSDTHMVFTNEYKPTPTEVVISGIKILSGRELKEDEFTFELEAITENAPMPTNTSVKNKADGKFAFGAIVFDQADAGKEYQYRVTEKIENESYMTYDKSIYDITIKVDDNGKGSIITSVTSLKDGSETEIKFVNEYDEPTPDTPDQITSTGDTAPVALWSILLLTAGTVLVLCWFRKKSKRLSK